jgi:hypothetical protein
MQKATKDRGKRTFPWYGPLLLGALALLLQGAGLAVAQGSEAEANTTCLTAQPFGAIALPFTVDGNLATSDVDFFQLTGPPGAVVRADLVALGPWDPFLGLFDSGCNLIHVNDDAEGFNARLRFTIPEDGVFILAATSCCDGGFNGAGGSDGPYQLLLTPVALIGSISGRVVDAVTGTSLRGDDFPFGRVALYRCRDSICEEFVTEQATDLQGRFLFTRDDAGLPLSAARYQVRGSADQYQASLTEPFTVGEGANYAIGDVRLLPVPIQFIGVVPCGPLPPAGGTCTYSVSVRNNTTTTFRGAVWSTVGAFGIGSPLGESFFQVGKSSGNPAPQKLNVKPQQSVAVQLEFDVPGTVADGAIFCADGWLGQAPQPTLNTVGAAFLFCISKEGGAFQVVPEKRARKLQKKVKAKH